jgi:hypothetical protein
VRGWFAFVGARGDANNDASKIGANLFLVYPKLELWIYDTFLFWRSLLISGAKFCQIEKNKQKNISPHLNCAFSLVTVF